MLNLRRLALATVFLTCACAGPARAELLVEPGRDRSVPEALESRDLEALLRSRPRLAELVDHASEHRFQVLVSVPDMHGGNWIRREGFRVDAEYFYPASAIKPCIAVAALEALGELRGPLDVRATFASERRHGGATLAMLVNGAMIVSDNDASNDLFDLAGFDGLHERMWRMGLSSVRVHTRIGVPPSDDARITPRIDLLPAGDAGVRSPTVIAAREGTLTLGTNDEPGVRVGESYFADGRVVDEPMSFEDKNRVSLVDLQDLMVALMRPELRPPEQRPHLGDSEQAAIVESLSTLPSRWGMKPAIEIEHKPLLPGLERVLPRRRLALASKSGHAYGFLVDNAYVADRKTGRSFFLTTTLYTNSNGRLNDDLYEYDSFAFPVLAELGEVVARNVFED